MRYGSCNVVFMSLSVAPLLRKLPKYAGRQIIATLAVRHPHQRLYAQMATLKPEAFTGFASAAAYDSYRPTFPSEAVDKLLRNLKVEGAGSARVADLAAGTGKFTELLSARPEKYEIVAIEPHDGMREQLDQKKLRGVTVVNGAAEDLSEIKDGTFGAVIVAQAFHWFANKTALGEIARILEPAGVLGLIWNIEDYNAPRSWTIHTGWEAKMNDVVWTFDDDQPRFRHEKWKHVFYDQVASNPISLHFADPLFSLPIGEDSVEFETWLSKETIWKRIRTLSQFAILEGAELESKKAEFFEAINSKDTPVDKDGNVAVHGRTFFAWSSRIPRGPLT